jgi:uncharacterized protein (DUF488 family)
MQPEIITLGVYGFESDSFFRVLLDRHIDIFCDLRNRRAMRGSRYAFANSERLQQRLGELGIRYAHYKELAPATELRALQKLEDEHNGQKKRTRQLLGASFVDAYNRDCLSLFDPEQFLLQIGPEVHVICLFCVERDPEACHRSLVAQRLARDLGLRIEHIRS